METRCPDCEASIILTNPGTDPAASAFCQGCGTDVQPGAFRCPHCRMHLHVVRTLLPADGGLGRCPDCQQIVSVPPLGAERAERAVTIEASAEPAVAVMSSMESLAATMAPAVEKTAPVEELGFSGGHEASTLPLEEAEEPLEDAAPEDLSPPVPPVEVEEPASPPVEAPAPRAARPSTRVAAPAAVPRQRARERGSSHRLLGFLLGAAVAAGGAYAVFHFGLWTPPAAPWEPWVAIPTFYGWAGVAGVLGALVGMLAGGRRSE